MNTNPQSSKSGKKAGGPAAETLVGREVSRPLCRAVGRSSDAVEQPPTPGVAPGDTKPHVCTSARFPALHVHSRVTAPRGRRPSRLSAGERYAECGFPSMEYYLATRRNEGPAQAPTRMTPEGVRLHGRSQTQTAARMLGDSTYAMRPEKANLEIDTYWRLSAAGRRDGE